MKSHNFVCFFNKKIFICNNVTVNIKFKKNGLCGSFAIHNVATKFSF